MNVKPGDLFRWTRIYDLSCVDAYDTLFSNNMQKLIPCNGLCLCVGIKQNVIYWICESGLFEANVMSKVTWRYKHPNDLRVFPQKVEL